jgi:hypothetical protein
MAPQGKEGGGSKRRKSINLFSRAALAGLAQINTDVPNGDSPQTAPPLENGDKKERKKLGKRASLFGLGPSASPDLQSDGTMSPVRSIERSDSQRYALELCRKADPFRYSDPSVEDRTIQRMEMKESQITWHLGHRSLQ